MFSLVSSHALGQMDNSTATLQGGGSGGFVAAFQRQVCAAMTDQILDNFVVKKRSAICTFQQIDLQMVFRRLESGWIPRF